MRYAHIIVLRNENRKGSCPLVKANSVIEAYCLSLVICNMQYAMNHCDCFSSQIKISLALLFDLAWRAALRMNDIVDKKKNRPFGLFLFMSALPIFPGSCPPSIFGTHELNYRVRDGNGWTLSVINTDYDCNS